MEYFTLVLLLIGVILLCVELFIPGFGMFGFSGVVLVIVSAYLTIINISYGIYIVVGEILFTGVIMYAFIKYVRTKQLYCKIILEDTLDKESKEIGALNYFMGKEGVTKTPLKPFGLVDFNGYTLEVCSEGNYILENKKIKVTEVLNNKIIVRELKSSQN